MLSFNLKRISHFIIECEIIFQITVVRKKQKLKAIKLHIINRTISENSWQKSYNLSQVNFLKRTNF
jgi:hypothetical protein